MSPSADASSHLVVPLVIYDGHCGFCTRCVHWLTARAQVRVEPWQTMHADRLSGLGLTETDVSERVYWADSRGRVVGGAAAVSRALRACGLPWSLAGRVIALPVVSGLAEVVYRFVARHRGRLPGVTPTLDR